MLVSLQVGEFFQWAMADRLRGKKSTDKEYAQGSHVHTVPRLWNWKWTFPFKSLFLTNPSAKKKEQLHMEL